MKRIIKFSLLLFSGINLIAMDIKPSIKKNCLRALGKNFTTKLMNKRNEGIFCGNTSESSNEYKNLVMQALARHKFPYTKRVQVKNMDHHLLFGAAIGWIIYLNEDKLNKLNEFDRIFTIEHEVAHMVLMHDISDMHYRIKKCLTWILGCCASRKGKNIGSIKKEQEKEADILAYQSLRDQNKVWVIKEYLNWLKNSPDKSVFTRYHKDYSYHKNARIKYTEEFLKKNK